jgi:serpin B
MPRYPTLLSVFVFLSLALVGSSADQKDAVADDTKAVVMGNNNTAIDLYAQLRAQEGNLFFSPYSISTALAMTYAGARGDTAKEMSQALHFSLDLDRLGPAFGSLYKRINGEGQKRGYQLSTANALWGQKDYKFLPEFLKLTRTHFGAGLQEVDFIRETEAARQTINQWVEKETKEKIKDLMPPGSITVDSRLVLTNAIYFKGDWEEQFKKDLTREEPFKLGGEKTVKVSMMNRTSKVSYFEGDGLQVLEMPYKGKDLSMVVLLPKKVDGLADFEKGLTEEKLAGWLGKLRSQEVIISFPKFKMTREFSLEGVLTRMGMKLAFVPNRADFSGMNGGTNLFVSAVMHKAFVEVNEEGTEAAAATGVVVTATSLPPPKPVFRADHQFAFLIRDMQSGSILFLGRVSNPAS